MKIESKNQKAPNTVGRFGLTVGEVYINLTNQSNEPRMCVRDIATSLRYVVNLRTGQMVVVSTIDEDVKYLHVPDATVKV